MIRRRLLPFFLSMTLLCPVLAASAEEQNPRSDVQSPAQAAPAKNSDGRVPAMRSDGSTVLTRPPDPKEIKKLVGYMRDGMNHADRAEKQRTTKRVIQNKRIYIRK